MHGYLFCLLALPWLSTQRWMSDGSHLRPSQSTTSRLRIIRSIKFVFFFFFGVRIKTHFFFFNLSKTFATVGRLAIVVESETVGFFFLSSSNSWKAVVWAWMRSRILLLSFSTSRLNEATFFFSSSRSFFVLSWEAFCSSSWSRSSLEPPEKKKEMRHFKFCFWPTKYLTALRGTAGEVSLELVSGSVGPVELVNWLVFVATLGSDTVEVDGDVEVLLS